MSIQDPKRLIKVLLISWFLFLVLLVGVVVYFSLHLKDLSESDVKQNHQLAETAKQISDLETVVDNLAQLKNIPGPAGLNGSNGFNGENGKDSVSTQTTVVKETPIKGDKGDSLKYEDLTEEQKAELKGADALQIELCKQRITLEIGWRYAGTTICLPIEVAQ